MLFVETVKTTPLWPLDNCFLRMVTHLNRQTRYYFTTRVLSEKNLNLHLQNGIFSIFLKNYVHIHFIGCF